MLWFGKAGVLRRCGREAVQFSEPLIGCVELLRVLRLGMGMFLGIYRAIECDSIVMALSRMLRIVTTIEGMYLNAECFCGRNVDPHHECLADADEALTIV